MSTRANSAAFGGTALGSSKALSWRFKALRNRLAGAITYELREAEKDAMGPAWGSPRVVEERELLAAALALLLGVARDGAGPVSCGPPGATGMGGK